MNRPVPAELHGTPTGYGYGCRCDECRAAKAAYRKGHRAGVQLKRGRKATGRKLTGARRLARARKCARCGSDFQPWDNDQRYCSQTCSARTNGRAHPHFAGLSRDEQLRLAGGYTQKQLRGILHEWQAEGRVCEYCGGPCETTDHVVPLSRGGANTLDNLVPACLWCNSSKGSKLLSEWEVPNAS